MTSARSLALALLVAGTTSAAAAQSRSLPADSLDRARRASALLIAGHSDSVISMMPGASEEVKQAVRRSAETFTTRAGTERALIEERWVWRQGQRQYWRIVEMTNAVPEPVVIRWVFSSSGALSGLGVSLLSAVPPTDSLSTRTR